MPPIEHSSQDAEFLHSEEDSQNRDPLIQHTPHSDNEQDILLNVEHASQLSDPDIPQVISPDSDPQIDSPLHLDSSSHMPHNSPLGITNQTKFFPKENELNSVRKMRKEKRVNIFFRWTFLYLDFFIWKANRKLVNETTVHKAEKEDESTVNYDKLKKNLDACNGNLYQAIFFTFWRRFIFAYSFRFVNDLLYYAGPYFLHEIVVFLKESQDESSASPPLWKGLLFAFGLLVVPVTQSIFIHQYFATMNRSFTHLSSALQCLIYRKSLKLAPEVRGQYASGQIVNLQSIDVEKCCNGLCYWSAHTWTIPLSLSLSLFFTFNILGWPLLAGILTLLVLLPLDALIGRWVGRFAREVLKEKDTRSKLIAGIIGGIRVIKFYAIEYPFQNLVLKQRRKEYLRLRSYLLFIAFQQFFSATIPMLTSLATFGVYFLAGGNLAPEKLFTALSLITSMRLTIRILPEYMMEMINSGVSLRRISKYLHSKEISTMPHLPKGSLHEAVDAHISEDLMDEENRRSGNEPHSGGDDDNLPPGVVILFDNASFKWSSLDPNPTLKNINLSINEGQLVSVIGSVGEGKSSLIHSLFGDVQLTDGTLQLRSGSKISFCQQEAWIVNATFRENVIMNEEYDEERYQKVISACALLPDLETFPAGSDTEVGETTLSGGQRARLSLARAIYRNADIYLLDSITSAVDVQVASHIYEQCIQQLLKDKTVLLVTHSLHLLSESDTIVVMENGTIKTHGSYSTLMQENADFSSMIRGYLEDVAIDGNAHDDKDEPPLSPMSMKSKHSAAFTLGGGGTTHETASISTHPTAIQTDEDASIETTDGGVRTGKLFKSESLKRGLIALSIYKKYIFGFTVPLLLMILICGILSKTFETGMDAWMSEFSKAESNQVYIYLIIYASLAVVASAFALMSSVSFFMGSLWSSNKMHDRLLNRLLHAPTKFYDQTPNGAILNRCTSDQSQIDSILPNDTYQTYLQLLMVVAVFGVIVYSSPYFLLLVPPILVSFYLLQRLYRTLSRELARLLNNSKSPIFSNLATSLEGASTIRAHNYVSEFSLKNDLLVSEYNNLYMELVLVNRWIGVRLESLSAVIIFIAAVFAVVFSNSMSPAIAGLTLTYSLTITRAFYRIVRYFSAMERSLVSVERIQEFSEIEQEAPFEYDTPRAPGMWPTEGKIVFSNVTMKYREELDYSLRGVNVTLEPGLRVGICGRSGSGKSSLIQTLFRAVELSRGQILIDGVDISTLGLHELRQHIAIIPQTPFIFNGSIRFNLDPFEEYSDTQLWEVLRKVKLKKTVEQMVDGLEHHLETGGGNISAGEQQLFCIARVLLKDYKIIVCDEATSNVSHEYDTLIQNVLRDVFRNKTLILIAHRLHTIMDADRILVMHNGRSVEYGSPETLLKRPQSSFARLVSELSTDTAESGNEQ